MRYVSRIIFILLACVFVYTTSTHAQEKYKWEYLYTIDGDSILFHADWVPLKKKVIIVRLDGVDTPERHSLCKEERNKAERAKEFVQEAMNEGQILVQPISWEKYGGRILGRVFIGKDQKDLSELLIAEGLAREYHGEKKKSWC